MKRDARFEFYPTDGLRDIRYLQYKHDDIGSALLGLYVQAYYFYVETTLHPPLGRNDLQMTCR